MSEDDDRHEVESGPTCVLAWLGPSATDEAENEAIRRYLNQREER